MQEYNGISRENSCARRSVNMPVRCIVAPLVGLLTADDIPQRKKNRSHGSCNQTPNPADHLISSQNTFLASNSSFDPWLASDSL